MLTRSRAEEALSVTVEPGDPFVPLLLRVMAGGEVGQAQAPSSLRVVHRRVTARSRLYFLSEGGPTPRLVAKVPLIDTRSEHPPLDAPTQFEALQRSHDWFRKEDRHGVAEPVAFFPDLGAMVMRYAPGPTVARAFADSVRHPETAMAAAWAAGDFLRRFHAHGRADIAEIRLSDMVDELQGDALEVLSPLRRALPYQLREVLRQAPEGKVHVRRVIRHGDYVGANLIVAGPHSVTMIDPALSEIGLPEDDLARFIAHLSSTTVFMAGGVWKPFARLRRRLEDEFLLGYGPLPNAHPVFELRLLRQQVLRWGRRTELSMAGAKGLLLRAQQLAIDAHMRGLLLEGAARLIRSLRPQPCYSLRNVAG